MKIHLVILVTLSVAFILNEVSAEEEIVNHPKRKHKKGRKVKTTTTLLPNSENDIEVREESYFDKKAPEDVISRRNLMDKISDSKFSDEKIYFERVNAAEAQVFRENLEDELARKDIVPITDACVFKHCGAGKVCELTNEGEAQCICIKECPQEVEVRRRVCTNYNETWGSDCEVYRRRCLCEENSAECEKPEYAHVHIEYYGECKQMPDCLPSEMEDFPRRMRDWLFTIMRDMADRDELSPHFLKLQREAETNYTRRWTNAAVWKFCDLDGHPPDRSVSRHELFPIRAPLMYLEHCIAPFLNKCDSDDNHMITLNEWAKCLELEEDDIEDQCEEVRRDEE